MNRLLLTPLILPCCVLAQEYQIDYNHGIVSLMPGLGRVTIFGPVEQGTPAAEAGLHEKDELVAIDGNSTSDIKTFAELKKRMDGAPHSTVELTVLTKEGTTRTASLKRIALISAPRVKAKPHTLLSYMLY